MRIKNYIQLSFGLFAAALITGCGAGGEDQGLEYAPNMYHSVPYEPLTQIKDKEAGSAAEWLGANDDGHGEYYNSNPLNVSEMTMRKAPENTVPRTKNGMLPYRIPTDSLELAARTLENPLRKDSTMADAMIADGKILYGRFCEHCHGAKGEGNGTVAGTPDQPVFAGIANLKGAAYVNITEGHIFHVITNGKGLMGAHGSQISPEERWKIAMYVKTLQQ